VTLPASSTATGPDGASGRPRGVLVTGGSSGIGLAVACAHARRGDTVVVLDQQQPVEHIDERIHVVVGDVTDPDDNQRAVETLLQRAGQLDHVVANAGVHDGGLSLQADADTLTTVMRRVFDVNVVGYALCARASQAALARTGGSLTFTLSDASFIVQGNAAGPAYIAAKHAALGLMRHLAATWAPQVRVNAVAPGGVITSLRAETGAGPSTSLFADPSGARTSIQSLNPLGTIMTPDEIAELYLFLASPAARGMTGEVLRPDGGLGIGRC
jgi:2,3-dihydroxy-2,3-dihydrophenylpropionate dehydrogenase